MLFIVVFLINFVPIIGKKRSNNRAHIGAKDSHDKENSINNDFYPGIIYDIADDGEIDQSEGKPNDNKEIKGKIDE